MKAALKGVAFFVGDKTIKRPFVSNDVVVRGRENFSLQPIALNRFSVYIYNIITHCQLSLRYEI